jgi:proteic killer suppression protein
MIITFSDRKLEKELNNETRLIKRWGPEQAKKIKMRLTELTAAENLEDMKTLPQARAHELSGNRSGQISLDVKHPYRLLIISDHEETPRKKDGGLDWKMVTRIKVVGVKDTHD